MTNIEKYVIDKIRAMRIEKGISQAELADMLNLSRGFIGDIETPKKAAKYNLEHINKLAIIFHCSPKEFLPLDPFPDDTL